MNFKGAKFYEINPIAKPRQTQRDKWMKRPCVVRYRAFADEVRAQKVKLPLSGAHVIFILPLPKSYSKKKQKALLMQEHTIRPDLDNLFKSLADACYTDDSGIWDVRLTKLWGVNGGFYVRQNNDK